MKRMMTLEEVYYTCLKSPLGGVWAASTRKGLLLVNIHGGKEKFLKEVKRRVKAKLTKDKGHLEFFRGWLDAYFKGEKEQYKEPLDLRGTVFQKGIWRAIYQVPYGSLTSYSDLAEEVGRPKAYRAAGNAVGSNPCGLVIPCHRVIRSNGGIGGFGGGLGLKRKLLKIEGILVREENDPANKLYLQRLLI
jgi:O-6-methylguanine DNA methyltransferase